MRHVLAALNMMLMAAANPAAAQTPVADLSLVLAVDGSSSVDIGEYALQMRGIAAAFRDPEVHGAVAAGKAGQIAVNVMVWAQPGHDKMTTGWRVIATPAEAEALAAAVEQLPRRQSGATGLGEGVEVALKAIAESGIVASRRVIDVSGDGRETWFAVATQMPVARRWANQQGVVINGLAITNEDSTLLAYYDEDVRTGPGSFAMEAKNYSDFAVAMKRKLLREILGSAPVSRLDQPNLLR